MLDSTINRTAALMVLVMLASMFAMIGATHGSTRRTTKSAFELGRW